LIETEAKDYGALIMSLCFVWTLVSIADYWLFIYHPFEVNILIENLQERDQIKLKEILQTQELLHENNNLLTGKKFTLRDLA
jgi:hypothetical protein